MMYRDETGRTVKANNYQQAAEKLYGQSKSFSGSPTTMATRHDGYAEVVVYKSGDKIGSYYGVTAATPVRHTLKRVK